MTIAIAVGAILALVAILSWLLRRFILWYWRINEALRLLASIDESLRELPAVRRHYYAQKQGRGEGRAA